MGGENKKETEKIISEKVNRRRAATLVIGWWLPPAAERRARVEVFFFIFSLVSIFFFSVCWLLLFSSLRKSTWALLVVFLSFPCREDDEPRPLDSFLFFLSPIPPTCPPTWLGAHPTCVAESHSDLARASSRALRVSRLQRTLAVASYFPSFSLSLSTRCTGSGAYRLSSERERFLSNKTLRHSDPPCSHFSFRYLFNTSLLIFVLIGTLRNSGHANPFIISNFCAVKRTPFTCLGALEIACANFDPWQLEKLQLGTSVCLFFFSKKP